MLVTKCRPVCLALILAIAAGCATNQTKWPKGDDGSDRDRIDEVETFLERSGRIAELAFPILTSNVELCGRRVTRSIGLSWLVERELPRGYRDVFVRRYGVSDSPTLDNVVDGGPAGAAGLRRWDTITAVDGEPVRGSARSTIREVFREAAEDGEITLTYERDARTMVAVIAPVPACDVGVHLVWGDQVDALADRNDIYITMGMYRIETDEGLQALIGHQLAHITAGHVAATQTRKAIGAGADGVVTVAGNLFLVLAAIAASASGDDVDLDEPFSTGWFFTDLAEGMFTHRDERTADRVSMYMLERSGLDPQAAIDFWRTIALENPETVPFAERHPVNAERLDSLDSVVAEVAAKRKAGQPMVPNP